jgi:NAD(P)H-nitrite reductase large subunit
MSFKQSHEMEGTLAHCLRQLTQALGHQDYDLSGDQIGVREAGLISSSFGNWQEVEGGEHAEAIDESRYRYLRLEFEDDLLVGALIQTRVRLGRWKDRLKQDPHRVVDAYIGCTQ